MLSSNTAHRIAGLLSAANHPARCAAAAPWHAASLARRTWQRGLDSGSPTKAPRLFYGEASNRRRRRADDGPPTHTHTTTARPCSAARAPLMPGDVIKLCSRGRLRALTTGPRYERTEKSDEPQNAAASPRLRWRCWHR
jgi:hypothetical protein